MYFSSPGFWFCGFVWFFFNYHLYVSFNINFLSSEASSFAFFSVLHWYAFKSFLNNSNFCLD